MMVCLRRVRKVSAVSAATICFSTLLTVAGMTTRAASASDPTTPPTSTPATPTTPAPASPAAAPVTPDLPVPTTAAPGATTAANAAPVIAPVKPSPPAKPAKEDSEVKEGREASEEMLKSGLKLVKDPALVERVERIGKKLGAIADVNQIDASYGSSRLVPYEYHFYIVDDPDVNAFSLPGGYIYINKGLLNYVQSDDELAGVIGHEITHAAHHHVSNLEHEQSKVNTQMLLGVLAAFVAHVPAADVANVMQGAQLLAIQKVNGFSQNAERDADHGGMILAYKGGYNPVGMLTFMERLARDQKMRPDVELGIFRTHPPEKDRVINAEAELKELNVPIRRRLTTNMLRVKTANVSWGNDPQGKPYDKIATEVLLDDKVIFRTVSQERGKAAAAALDKVLDDDIQLYDVAHKGDSILIRGQTIFTVLPEDMVLPGSLPTPDAVATAGYKQLRNVLFREMIANG